MTNNALAANSTTSQLTLPVPPSVDGHAWEPPEPVDADQRAVLDVLRDGRTHSRGEMVAITRLPERAVRSAIAELRLRGWPVCASSGRTGYRLTFNATDLDALEQDLRARALSALRVRSAIRRVRQRRVA